MDAPSKNLLSETGMNVAAWLPKRLANVFRRHVSPEYGAASKFAVAAIEEKLRREGAFAAKQDIQAAEVLKKISPESLPLLVAFAELLETRGVAFVRGKLEELSVETANAEKAVA